MGGAVTGDHCGWGCSCFSFHMNGFVNCRAMQGGGGYSLYVMTRWRRQIELTTEPRDVARLKGHVTPITVEGFLLAALKSAGLIPLHIQFIWLPSWLPSCSIIYLLQIDKSVSSPFIV